MRAFSYDSTSADIRTKLMGNNIMCLIRATNMGLDEGMVDPAVDDHKARTPAPLSHHPASQ